MKYPILEPIPIRTKGLSLLMRIWVWLFSVRTWKLVDDWEFETKLNEEYVTIFIEKNFIFDGASIPRALWWLLQPMGVLLIPGLVHDYAYRYQKVVTINKRTKKKFNRRKSDRKFWDLLFREISIQVNGCKIISYFAWVALFLFGRFAWNKNRKIEQKRINEDWKRLSKFK
jgi:hypothetical protein